jgi:hypothetical protein
MELCPKNVVVLLDSRCSLAFFSASYSGFGRFFRIPSIDFSFEN